MKALIAMTRALTIRFPETQWSWLHAQASRRGWSVARLLREKVEEWMSGK